MNPLLNRVVAGLAVVSAASVLAGPRALTVAGGMVLGFALPGMALTGAIFARRRLSPVERILLAPALSLAVLIVAGLIINMIGVRLDRVAWTVATAGVTLLAALAVELRWSRTSEVTPQEDGAQESQPDEVAAAPLRVSAQEAVAVAEGHTIVMSVAPVKDEEEVAAEEKSQRYRLVKQLLPLALVLVVLGGASWLSFATSRNLYDTPVTALTAEPSGPVDAEGDRVVTVAASGLLRTDGPYTLTVARTGGGGTPTRRNIPVSDDGTWSERLTMPGDQRMTVSLFRAGDLTPYRTLFISAVS
ncbi:hypothetical protein [Actinoplanes sp. NPDC051859]|uniref:hypothetical protein n=1 Tax=Actinoplanes sp. NPDC051859 TaxID=3363909 RepID=UPI0037BC47B9